MAFHLRSISLPSRPHPTGTEIEEEMLSLEASISSSTTIGMMCEGQRRLGDIYNGVEEIICLPSSQVCAYQQRTVLDGEMDGSLELLDLCGTMQEIFAEMKAIIQELQLSLRKGDDAAAQASIQSYTSLAKKAKNHFKKTTKKISADCRMVMLLAKAREISVSLLESTLHLLSKQIEMPKRSLVSKAFHRRKSVFCKEEQLSKLECSIIDLESGAGHLFRKLVQSRVSLLNILSS
ncbi:uncharacterized protein LOC119314438 [Triticum dicoccoides]|uniref:uncharacterized protein LOC119314438 n=1 Tax=Triticum dicoccoides TaxID=85692 RepID=UPI001891CD1A|nr:uncharacterized protein LOC119314438 [Triticum dicoccoides]XP_037445050.1 uncharacterized protein LOC119314438 [Triticum dicoccoides]XP_037445051.1 uncharacterized protein LOC119314438 [Triticum dicoccoides]XP_037445052.1 uncharacterized protein LOC119314438 [Triticum dicoccoides]XP_037445053.1 uncharacterized protein LOC119314438 [Triticum dicoccoides]XP_037445054.1 uncharacterized protein LOC119314438 [Triticum dicoccoides]XP_037445055.1 uncharacterized protein LOC119314438 [Triticum dic